MSRPDLAGSDARCVLRFREEIKKRPKLRAVEKYAIVSGLIDIASADGRIDPAELERLRELGGFVGVSGAGCELIVRQYCGEKPCRLTSTSDPLEGDAGSRCPRPGSTTREDGAPAPSEEGPSSCRPYGRSVSLAAFGGSGSEPAGRVPAPAASQAERPCAGGRLSNPRTQPLRLCLARPVS